MKKILMIMLILILSVLGFELFLRYSPFSSGISPVEYDEDLGMWHKKDFTGYMKKECYKTKYSFDEFGRVANNYAYDASKKDIILLGDSQVEALMVENKKVMHNSLYKELDGKYNVLNYGLSGTGPAQQHQILKNKVNLTTADTILHFVFLENDLNDADPQNFTAANRPKVYIEFKDLQTYKVIKPRVYDVKEKLRDFLAHFELYAYLKKSYYHYTSLFHDKPNVKNKLKIEKSFSLANEEYKWKQLKGSIYQINKIAKELGLKYKIVIYSAYEFDDGYKQKRKRLQRFLNNHNIENLNIVPFLKSISKNQQLSFDCDSHWNGKTHLDIAKYITKEFL